MNEEAALRRTFTVTKVTETRSFSVLPYKIKCKWKNLLRKQHCVWKEKKKKTDRQLQERKIKNSLDLQKKAWREN